MPLQEKLDYEQKICVQLHKELGYARPDTKSARGSLPVQYCFSSELSTSSELYKCHLLCDKPAKGIKEEE